MAESGGKRATVRRHESEQRIATAVRAIGAISDRLGRIFARGNGVTNNELLALQHIIVSEHAGTPLSSGELGRRLDLSSSAVTYVVDRLIAAGHVHRHTDEVDRRRVILRYSEHGRSVAQAFFGPLGAHMHSAMIDLPDSDLDAARRVLEAVERAMTDYYEQLASRRR